MPTLNGACPGCGQTLTLEIAVRTAPRGFAGNDPIRLQEHGLQPGAPSAVNSGDGRPTCPECGLDAARLEQTAKKSGRPFTAWKCINTDCDQNDQIIPGTFRWGTAAA